jgi:molybdopterin-binding protein
MVAIAPEDVVLFAQPPNEHGASLRNVLEGIVKAVAPAGRLLRVDVEADGLEVGALITRAAFEDLGLTVGGPVAAAFKASTVDPLSRHDRDGDTMQASD